MGINSKLIQGVDLIAGFPLIAQFHLQTDYKNHSMAVTMTQQHIPTGMPYSDPDYIRRKPKQDLQSHQFPEAKNYRYKCPVNPKN